MSEDVHERIARWLERPSTAQFSLERNTASDLLDEWEDAQAMIRALNVLVDALQTAPQPPAWIVIA